MARPRASPVSLWMHVWAASAINNYCVHVNYYCLCKQLALVCISQVSNQLIVTLTEVHFTLWSHSEACGRMYHGNSNTILRNKHSISKVLLDQYSVIIHFVCACWGVTVVNTCQSNYDQAIEVVSYMVLIFNLLLHTFQCCYLHSKHVHALPVSCNLRVE